ncbi:MAG: hypothetical protein AB1798_15520 [Spirochaetota bacterium]
MRLYHKKEPNIFQLQLNFSYYEMFTPIIGKGDFVAVAGITTKRQTPINPKIGKVVFMFGGSTTVGVESNEKTIASHLALISQKSRQPLIVENYGVGSFRSSEELMKLIKLLRAGFKPNYVIFYDGYNDTEFAIRKQTRYDFLSPVQDVFKSTVSVAYFEKVLRQFEVYKLMDYLPLLQSIVRNIFYRLVNRNGEFDSSDGIDNIELKDFDDIKKYCVDNYYQNIKMVKALGKEYNFVPIFVLQPMIYFKKHLSSTEESIMKNLPDEYKDLTPKLYKAIVERMLNINNFYTITDVFDGHLGTIFMDQGHILSNGNRVVAKKLFEIISDVR